MDVTPGFSRRAEPEYAPSYRALTAEQVVVRSAYLQTKPDATAYLVDRLCREVGVTREEALQVDLDAVKEVVEGGATVLRVGLGNNRRNVPAALVNLPLFTQVRDFMVSRNRKTLAWSNLDRDAALQKYKLRLSYVTRTLFPETKRGAKAVIQKGGAA